ncbi:hypothetical protein [Curtobacterium sp. MCBD17_003]|uniref:hypothetical protein n=1 Tax=Curtobacterium sp. MCBD17_003 TaxID=2175667 RepID=UPI000DA9AD85|nr:hypothetical protein [Curtobacterium sp. MCBD17_003]WIE56109.1 hypothetical protein DEI88_007935 [Curtobacterium sp. MCBD17_003]
MDAQSSGFDPWVAYFEANTACVDHAEALRACGRRPLGYWGRALRRFRSVARSALWSGHSREPSEPDDRPHLLGPEVAIDVAS